ncbi:MAG: LysR family transcriptional regulator [Alphaproteobacteria bacterium]|jgi:DNA-binding transcriptional LysR family regulator|nr:LysR family transcriptional regulator [Alphaproteobacteria bacterium]
MSLQLEHIRSFYHTVRLGSMKSAAKHIGISLSAVSNYVGILEKQMNGPLMIRNKSGIRLTPEGVKLFQAVKEGISSLEEVGKNFILDDQQTYNSDIILNTWTGVASYIVTKNLSDFFKTHSNVRLHIKCHSIDIPYDEWVGDVAISPFLVNRKDLFQKKIFRIEYGLYASHAYVEKYGLPKKPEELDHHHLVSTTRNDTVISDQVDWHLKLDTDQIRKPVLSVDSSIAVFQAIRDGCGIGIVPNFFLEAYNARLVPVLPDIEIPHIDYYFIMPLHNKNMSLYNTLLNHFLEI